MNSLKFHSSPNCFTFRRFYVLAICGIVVSSNAMALDIRWGTSLESCAACPAQFSSIDGCIEIFPDALGYDIFVTGLTNGDVASAELVRANSGTCTPTGATLVTLAKVGPPSTSPAHLFGSVLRTPGSCPGDPADCVTAGEAIVHIVAATADECFHELIKDNSCNVTVPTVSEWGVIVMITLLMVAGTMVFRHRYAHSV